MIDFTKVIDLPEEPIDPEAFKIGQAHEYGMFCAYMDHEYGNGFRRNPKHPDKVSLVEQQAFAEGYEEEKQNIRGNPCAT